MPAVLAAPCCLLPTHGIIACTGSSMLADSTVRPWCLCAGRKGDLCYRASRRQPRRCTVQPPYVRRLCWPAACVEEAQCFSALFAAVFVFLHCDRLMLCALFMQARYAIPHHQDHRWVHHMHVLWCLRVSIQHSPVYCPRCLGCYQHSLQHNTALAPAPTRLMQCTGSSWGWKPLPQRAYATCTLSKTSACSLAPTPRQWISMTWLRCASRRWTAALRRPRWHGALGTSRTCLPPTQRTTAWSRRPACLGLEARPGRTATRGGAGLRALAVLYSRPTCSDLLTGIYSTYSCIAKLCAHSLTGYVLVHHGRL